MVEVFKVLFELEGVNSWRFGGQTLAPVIVGGAMPLVNSKTDLPLSSNCHCDRGDWGVRFECGDVCWLVVSVFGVPGVCLSLLFLFLLFLLGV